MPSSVFVAVPLMLLLTVLQTAVLPRFPIFGYVPQLGFLFAIAWTLIEGQNEGLIWAFIAGLMHDLFSIAPMGGSSLTYMVAVLVVSAVVPFLPKNRFLAPILLMALATVIQQLLYFLYLRLFGYGIAFSMVSRLLPMVVLNAVTIFPVYWLTLTVYRTLRPRAVEL